MEDYLKIIHCTYRIVISSSAAILLYYHLCKVRRLVMFKGILYALGACFLWGLIFVVPEFMQEFSTFEIALGRYFVFGLASSVLFMQIKARNRDRFSYPLSIWIRAALFALSWTFGFYVFLIQALKYSSPFVCAIILGVCPLVISALGNRKERSCRTRQLIIPFAFIVLGLVLINLPRLSSSPSVSHFLLGILCCFVSLILWCWYVVANSRFLKEHKEVSSNDWATMQGVTTFGWALVFMTALLLTGSKQITLVKFAAWSPSLLAFIVGSSILGILCSWLGAYFWNKASVALPVSLAGQLTIFETVFVLIFSSILQQRLPLPFEWMGLFLVLIPSLYCMRLFQKPVPEQAL